MADQRYSSTTVPVRGGDLAVGVWGAEGAAADVIALHGLTSNHLVWSRVAARLPGARIIAPDLRGRGRSNGLPAPWNVWDQAEDVAAVAAHFGITQATVIAHAAGGVVAGWLAARHPEVVSRLVLADGGPPILEVPSEPPPAYRERLTRTYRTRAEYHDQWRLIPSLTSLWDTDIEAFADYDLEPVQGGFRAATRYDPVAATIVQLDGGKGYAEALASLTCEATFLWPTRDYSGVPALYSEQAVAAAVGLLPGLVVERRDDLDHYSIVFDPVGVEAVAAAAR